MHNKYHLKYIIFLIAFTISLDYGFGKIYELLYFSQASVRNDRLIHSVLNTNEDILVFGSSRALHHYNPRIIKDILGMTCYNVGSGGQNIYFHLALLNSILERYIPKIAILELYYTDFEKTMYNQHIEQLSVLLPFAKKSKAIHEAVMLRSNLEELKLISKTYQFNSTQYIIFRNNCIPLENNIDGFIPIHRLWTGPLEEIAAQTVDYDTLKMNALNSYIDLCKENSIQLYIFISPHYVVNREFNRYKNISEYIEKRNGITTLNYEADSTFMNHPEYFADPNHLNFDGANIYTRIISAKIKKTLQEDSTLISLAEIQSN